MIEVCDNDLANISITKNKIEKSKNNSKRIKYLDIARCIAIICVVLCHAVEKCYYDGNLMLYSNQSVIFYIIIHTIGRLGVPIFMFLSGYLLLSRNYENEQDIRKFYKNNFLSLLITTEIWIIIYNIYLGLLDKKFYLKSIILEILFLQYVPMVNMWYMPMILGIYMILPFLSLIIKKFSKKILAIPIIIDFIIFFIIPTINVILSTFKMPTLGSIFDASYLGGCFGIYFVFGYYIKEGILKNIRTKNIILVSLVSFICVCCILIFLYMNNNLSDLWYNSPFIFLCTLFLFELFKRINTDKIGLKLMESIENISKLSLGIFFIHVIVEDILTKYIGKMNINRPIRTVILFTISFLLSYLITFVFSKIKLLKKYLIRVK